ncbi:L,D-transpeptidase, partial [Mycolicibacterium sp. GF69]|uniref:L,D-transpeptidase n=1 Tax=Mycolicibacterium sp. GF69 TaxID=2267251 RepID=UPI001F0C31B9
MAPSAGTPVAAAAATEAFGVIRVLPGPGEVVGVAHPVVVQFMAPVVNRTAAEGTVAITASQSMTGEFTWLDATTLEWKPAGYWPAYDRIEVRAGGLKTEFSTGAAVVGIADIDAHTFTVEVDGEVVREMPASLGKPG